MRGCYQKRGIKPLCTLWLNTIVALGFNISGVLSAEEKVNFIWVYSVCTKHAFETGKTLCPRKIQAD